MKSQFFQPKLTNYLLALKLHFQLFWATCDWKGCPGRYKVPPLMGRSPCTEDQIPLLHVTCSSLLPWPWDLAISHAWKAEFKLIVIIFLPLQSVFHPRILTCLLGGMLTWPPGQVKHHTSPWVVFIHYCLKHHHVSMLQTSVSGEKNGNSLCWMTLFHVCDSLLFPMISM